jgi:hypothetical protein
VSDEAQVTFVVRSWVVLSEKVPVAANCLVVPAAIEGSVGVTSIDTSVAVVTVSPVVPEMLPRVAVMVTAPDATAVASPSVPLALETVAMVSSEEDQVTLAVRSWVVLFE